MPRDGLHAGADDSALLDGRGHYTTARVRAGRVLWLDRHLARLTADAKQLGLPAVDELTVRTAFSELACAAFGDGDGAIRLQHSGGATGHSHWLGIPRALGEDSAHWHAVRAPLLHEGPRPWSGTKRSGSLDTVLARDAARQQGADEALFEDAAGRLIEGARSNLFVVLADGTWATPDVDRGGVAGLARAVVLEHSRRFAVRDISFHALGEARELVAVNALRGARPIVSLAGTPIGSPAGPAFALIDSLLDLH